MHTLYLTTSVKDVRVPENMRSSPHIILDVYIGSHNNLSAPDWMHWGSPLLEFHQPRSSFAELFVQMSMWQYNWHQVCMFCTLISHMNDRCLTARLIIANGEMGESHIGEKPLALLLFSHSYSLGRFVVNSQHIFNVFSAKPQGS
jgi:hypothetical protein